MIALVTFLLAAFGLVYAVTESVLLAGFRTWFAAQGVLAEVFVNCAYCVGFWAGAGIQLALSSEVSVRVLLVDPVLGGCLVMGAIAVVRAFAPEGFLQGAWERERSIIQALRSGSEADR